MFVCSTPSIFSNKLYLVQATCSILVPDIKLGWKYKIQGPYSQHFIFFITYGRKS
jgi:hypothetical protein